MLYLNQFLSRVLKETYGSDTMSTLSERFLIAEQLKALIQGEPNLIANLSNASALLFQHLPNINWVGFYLYEKDSNQLVLGPFQGKPACLRIDIGKGVCGTAFQQKKSILVPDVNEFPGHIVCDAASRSEIVVPLFNETGIFGVLDIDAPVPNRFTKDDQLTVEAFRDILMNAFTESNKEIDFLS